jgi:oxaloacetate decarboxylase alpha subunit
MRYHTPYDALNDIRNLEIPITEAKRHGLTVVPGIVFTESPVHTDEYYVKKTKEVMARGVEGIFLKDPSGLLRPERARTLVKSMKAVMGDMPLQLHSHCLSGLAPYTALCAVEAGVEVLHSATSPLANGASHPSTQVLVNNLRRMGYNIDIDLNNINEVSEIIKFIAAKEDKPLGKIAEYDEFHFHHQVAGGMISNLEYQLSTVGLADRLDDILQEAGNVRADLGYPIVVSPFAQYIITQSVLNVVAMDNGKERFSNVPDEVRLYVRGGYGEIAGEIDPNLYDRITKGTEPITQRPGELVPPALEKTRNRLGASALDDDVLLAVFYDNKEYDALKAAGPIDTEYPIMETPLKTLIKGITSQGDVTSFHFIDRKNSLEASK